MVTPARSRRAAVESVAVPRRDFAVEAGLIAPAVALAGVAFVA